MEMMKKKLLMALFTSIAIVFLGFCKLSFAVEPEKIFKGHTKGVTSIAFSPDGRYLISGSSDKTLKLWDFPGGREIRTFDGHKYSIDALAITPEGRFVVSGS